MNKPFIAVLILTSLVVLMGGPCTGGEDGEDLPSSCGDADLDAEFTAAVTIDTDASICTAGGGFVMDMIGEDERSHKVGLGIYASAVGSSDFLLHVSEGWQIADTPPTPLTLDEPITVILEKSPGERPHVELTFTPTVNGMHDISYWIVTD